MRITNRNINRIIEYARYGRVVAFDTETTGMDKFDEICQIAAVEYVNGVRGRTFGVYLQPSCEMNPFAEAVHGLSMDFLSEHGIAPVEGMTRFFDFLGTGDMLLVAHNIRFDLRMARQECRKFGIQSDVSPFATCDTVALARVLCPALPSYRLGRLIETLAIEGINSHDALDDACACGSLFFHLIGSVPVLL